MANWKELGEVPDSEDDEGFYGEQFDSQSNQAAAKPALTDDVEQDIWDFPDSPTDDVLADSQAPAVSTPCDENLPSPTISSPLSSPPSEDELPPLDDFTLGDGPQRDAKILEQEDVDRADHLQIKPCPSRTASLDFTPSPPGHAPRSQLPLDESGLLSQMAETFEAQRVAARYERSLRPRKPIQEHPYLLENAQYSSFLKLHGVKPLRMAIENERRKRDHLSGGLSQDGDFQEESQESVQPDITNIPPLYDAEPSETQDDLLLLPSTPPRHSPTNRGPAASSPVSSQGETDNTSVLDQDLPALDELLRKPPKLTSTKPHKRISTPLKSSTRKRMRRSIISSDPIDGDSTSGVLNPKSPFTSLSPSLNTPGPLQGSPINSDLLVETPKTPAAGAAAAIQPSTGNHTTHASPSEDGRRGRTVSEISDPTSSDDDSLSVSDNEAVTTMSRRIRGVLPASWLRLDQQAGQENAKKSLKSRTRFLRSPGRENRRGVAQLRHGTLGSTPIPMFDDESDHEVVPIVSSTNANQSDSQPRSTVTLAGNLNLESMVHLGDDEDVSVVEDDAIDFMLSKPSRKRQLKLTDSLNAAPKKRPKRRDLAPKQGHRKEEQVAVKAPWREAGTRGTSGSSRSENVQHRHPSRQKRNYASKSIVQRPIRKLPPSLSILDTIQPDAPRFLKIAARTARSRRNQGRSRPNTKTIQLATRQDQLDAVTVLNSWRSGAIKPRDSVTAMTKSFERKRHLSVLSEVSGNTDARDLTRTHHRADVSRKLIKQVSHGGSIRYISSRDEVERQKPKSIQRSGFPGERYLPISTRPAQLETGAIAQMTKSDFYSRKKLLDRLYQNGKSASGRDRSDSSSMSARPQDPTTPASDVSKARTNKLRRLYGSRNHRKAAPQRIDLDAPQYSHARDPVPEVYLAEQPVPTAELPEAKLNGLGPYGTQYTHHFESFPLHPDVFFHESTLIGSGELSFCETFNLPIGWSEARPVTSLLFNNHILRWGLWNEQTSSELGVVLDYIAEYAEAWLTGKLDARENATAPSQVASFVLSYVKDSIAFMEQHQRLSFISRTRECLENFNDRIDSATRTAASVSNDNISQVLPIYDRLLLIAFLTLRICAQDPSLMAEQFSMEKLVQSMATTGIVILIRFGIGNLQELYIKLQTKRYREGGIRNDSPLIHSWVVTMKVLDLAQIPRSSFWDVAQRPLAPDQELSRHNAQDHERIWERMFTLLPLVEFGNTGVLVSGRRQSVSGDGWAIPHKLLRQVFQLYERNPRQAASFNNYCRALIGRCHYLVQEWGWRKCVSVVGLVFDFFGSQQLAHLRNEEVYKSPRFLENLNSRPNLEIEREDPCFHVFLKLVAVAIRKLREVGSVKDIGNLVTRTVPNHNRQHRKDEIVHARDLAALRNHHDLLCTLFWAAPPDCRPSPVLIQNLVDPADSHKEACLINLRAWTQLARFNIASGEIGVSWKAFHKWRGSFFEQILKQFNSVASEVAQQLSTLGKEASHSITAEMVHTAVSVNKAALIDVLYASLTSSLDAIQHAPNLQAATFAWNLHQLQTIFTHFAAGHTELTWAVLKASLAILDTMLSKIDDFKADDESQQSESQISNSAVADDALLVLDAHLSRAFFGMARCVLSMSLDESGRHTAFQEQAECSERIVVLAARMCMRYINGGLIRLSGVFKGKYQVFNESPHKLDLRQRQFMVLFVLTLLRYDIDDFDEAGFTLCEFWILSLVKPRAFLKYEIELGQELRRHGRTFLPEGITSISVQPDYNTNRDLLEYAISMMRKAVRDAGPDLRSILVGEYSSSLKLAMEQIRGNLKNTAQRQKEHESYVVFVQDVISLIKTHGSDICAVDNYFCQISKEYWPPAEDPQLKVANLKSYGLRLQEGESRVGRQLFHFLFNNAKFSIFNNKLPEEVQLLYRGMCSSGIKTFIISRMMPAIVKASFEEYNAFPLLDIYMEAFELRLAGMVMALELDSDDLPSLCTMVQAILNGMKGLYGVRGTCTRTQVHVLRQTIGLANLLWPSIHVLSMSTQRPEHWIALWSLLTELWAIISKCEVYLEKSKTEERRNSVVEAQDLLAGVGSIQSEEHHLHSDVVDFAKSIVEDVRKNWKVTGDKVTIQIPGQQKGATPGTVATFEGWTLEGGPVNELNEAIHEWIWWWHKANAHGPIHKHHGSVVF